MSREILFRARRVDNSEWAEGYFVRDLDIPYIVVPVKNGITDYLEVDPSTVCQYTGLKDASGNKIWENDIIIVKGSYDSDVGIVRYGKYGYICGETDLHVGFYVNWQNNHAMWRKVLGYWAKDYSICGNAFDNPELLEGGTDEDD